MTFLFVHKEPFNNIINNTKTIEIRRNKGFIITLKPNTKIYFKYKNKIHLVKIEKIEYFESLYNLLNNTTISLINPNLENIEHALTYFNTYYKNFNTEFSAIYFK